MRGLGAKEGAARLQRAHTVALREQRLQQHRQVAQRPRVGRRARRRARRLRDRDLERGQLVGEEGDRRVRLVRRRVRRQLGEAQVDGVVPRLRIWGQGGGVMKFFSTFFFFEIFFQFLGGS